MPNSLSWIKIATGSLGQGLSVGVGMSLGNKLKKNKSRTYVLLGDSELFEGSNYEAIQLAVYYKLNNLILIVDINRLGQRGQTIFGHEIKKYKKRFLGFGLNVLTIDGHKIIELKKALKKARKSKIPTIILAKTFKGKGISFLENKEGWHGKPLDEEELKLALKELPKINFPAPPGVPLIKEFWGKRKTMFAKNMTRIVTKKYKIKLTNYKEETSTRQAYGNYLKNLTSRDKNTLVLDSEVSNSTYSEKVKENNPKQFIECFIGEQNMVGMSLGLDKKNFKVFASTFAAFLTRAYDQLRMASYSNPKNIFICGSHCGVSIGQDGASQMGLEDISLARSLFDSYVFYPSDAISTQKIIEKTKDISGIKYIRTTRMNLPIIYKKNDSFEIGKFKILKQSKEDKVVLVGSGITLHECLKANRELKKRKINCAVIDIYCIKPFNHENFFRFVARHGKKIIIVEDHYKAGGIGEMILSELKNNKLRFKHLYVHKLPHSGTPEELLQYEEIDSNSIIKKFEEPWE